MSMFNIGLSGLKSTQTGLEVTSNNIANSGTAGYKNNTAEFAAVYNGSQRGGVKVANVKEDFVTGGEIVRTGNALDIAIDGQGFFAISENGRTAYTQAGQFQLDNDLNIVNANGGKLQGFGVSQVDGGDPTIVPGVLTDLKIEASNIEAQASTNINCRIIMLVLPNHFFTSFISKSLSKQCKKNFSLIISRALIEGRIG